MSSKTLVYPFKLLFKASFKEGVFWDCWKKLSCTYSQRESKNPLDQL